MALRIRPAQSTDVEPVVALVQAVLTEFKITFGQGSDTDAQLFALPGSYSSAGGAFFIAEDADGRLVGTAGVFPTGPGLYELRKMYLLPATRGTGAGQQLFDACLDFVRAQQGTTIALDTTEQMVAAIRFYERNGFVRDDTQRRASRCSRGYRLDVVPRQAPLQSLH
jgi:putative acetyltransferase